MTRENRIDCDVLVVGGGPAGLSAASELRARGVARVLVVERETQAGGVPRHCHHTGFGLRDLHRAFTGPRYADELVRRAIDSGVQILTGTTITSLDKNGEARATNASGLHVVNSRVVLLASGARERPRSARLVAGDRPPGVFTTGQLQQWVYVHGLPVGSRALVVGAEHVSFSAMLTLRHAHVKTLALVTDLEAQQSVAPFALAARRFFGVPVWTRTRLVAVNGRERVREVVLEDLTTGIRRVEAVDVVVFTGDWIPDNELARRAGVDIDPGTLGPASDIGGHTNVASIYATGNLLHPVETADVATLRSREVARALANDLEVGLPSSTIKPITLVVEPPLSWVWPNRFDPSSPARRVALRTKTFSQSRLLVARQDGREFSRVRLGRVVPNRSLGVDAAFLAAAQPDRGPVSLSLG
jgi:NADPH-dependent 2,4-dienoyl-CoA reductase/sulfur reductase-like enzyme